MGLRMAKISFTPGENEQIETVITLPEEKRSIIHGAVKDYKNRLVKDAIIKLFEVMDCHDHHPLKPITHTFSDENGQFILGPLLPGKTYMIMAWIDSVKIRELVIRPDNCPQTCVKASSEEILSLDDMNNPEEKEPFPFDVE